MNSDDNDNEKNDNLVMMPKFTKSTPNNKC
jgi:hypothetical protein